MEKLIRVEWHDAASTSSHWQDEITVASVVSVGFLIEKDRKQIVMALSRAADGDYGGKFAIPRGFVKSIQNLAPIPAKKKKKVRSK